MSSRLYGTYNIVVYMVLISFIGRDAQHFLLKQTVGYDMIVDLSCTVYICFPLYNCIY